MAPAPNFTTGTNVCDIGVAGNGTLNVLNGATATIGSGSKLGTNSTGVGDIGVYTVGTSLTMGTGVIIGSAGTGYLTVGDGATASIGSGLIVSNAIGTSGTITLGIGTLTLAAQRSATVRAPTAISTCLPAARSTPMAT